MVGKLEDFVNKKPSEDGLDEWQRTAVGRNVRLFIPLEDSASTGAAVRELQKMVNDLVEVDYRHRHDAHGHPKAVESEFHYLRDIRDAVMRARTMIEPGRKRERQALYPENVTRLRR